MVNEDTEDDEPLATWEAALLPNWEWEAYEKTEDDLYYGRVRSPNTFGKWEYGYFSESQLRKAGAYRTDLDADSDEPLYPDGGGWDDLAELKLFETELEALQYLEGEGD
jgi:hypothetical protein